MSIKLLAIRPLKGCDNKFLKNLKKNCIYRFYNEYDYHYPANSESYIKYQSKIDSDSEIEYRNINNISKNQQIPNDFYSNKINISAIVGKNGSGKSSLLELLYAFNFNISKKYKLLEVETNNCKIELELYIKVVELTKITYYKIHIKSTNKQNILKFYKSINNCEFEILPKKDEKNIALKIYNLTINYSLYGLNSKFNGNWIKNLFHKNDGYETPIVINPFRKEGNIDVNNEFNLAQSRLVLNHYLIDNKILIDNISLHEVEFIINIKEIQYYKDSNGNVTSVIDDINNFLKKNHFNDYSLFLNYIFGNYTNNNLIIDKQGVINNIDSISDITYLCFIYIYKKIKKICNNYDQYTPFQILFNDEWDNNFFSKDADKVTKNIINKFKIENDCLHFREIEDSLQKFILNKIKAYNIENNLIENIGFTKQDTFDKYLIEFKETYKEKPDVTQFIKFFLEKADEEFEEKKTDIFKNLMINLNRDSSHITFKLKQAISYFKNDFFEKNIYKFELNEDENEKVIDNEYVIRFNNEYFQKTNIENIPLAFFKLKISINNKGEIYDFFRLSSGEQQMIHSLLNIKYHLYNLKSIKQGNRRKYRDINIIFDEVELYFHPEYQRLFISNLINHLKWFTDFKFNVIFATHSPFILSDIPSQNVLKLENGLPITDNDGINSFGSNIHDLLADEFFLGNGFMGEFASNKIENLIHKIKSKETIDELTYDKYLLEINLIGEKVLKFPLLELLEEKREKNKLDNNDLINFYQKQIDKLKNQ